MTDWYLGTMGFSYEDWAGVFYPENLHQKYYLKHYCRFFNAVEIDSTFYGTPRLSTVKRWLSVVPEEFRFCLKTPRIITHEKGLRAAHLDMAEFLSSVGILKDKLGVILIQLPPSFHADQMMVLNTFLNEQPRDLRFAVEFRDRSWHQPQTAQMLAKHNACWAATEYPSLSREVRLTSAFIYFRIIGQHGQFRHHDCLQIDRTANLSWWHQHLQARIKDVEAVYGFFNNDYAGFGAGSCNQFKRLVGLPAPDLKPPQQGRLF